MITLKLQQQSVEQGLQFFLEEQIKNDKKIMMEFGVATHFIKQKYKNSKIKQKLKLEATKNLIIDNFLFKFLKRKEIVINIKNKMIKDYFKKKEKCSNEYDDIMRRLDLILIKDKPFIDEGRFQKYLDRFGKSKGKQYYFYFEKKGRDRFKYSESALNFYDNTGKEPWKIKMFDYINV